MVQKNSMIQVASCERALIKTSRKPIQNHQSKTRLLFKTQEFKSDRHLKHTVSSQGIQRGLFVFLVGEFGTFKTFMHTGLFGKA